MIINKILLTLSTVLVVNATDALRFPVFKNYSSVGTIQKRSTYREAEFELYNEDSFYSIAISLGSENHTVFALLDTGSSDLWVFGMNDDNLNACESYLVDIGDLDDSESTAEYDEYHSVKNNCEKMGVFDPSTSKTFQRKHSSNTFYTQYGDYSYAEGIWGQDLLYIGGIDLSSLLFAVANTSNSTSVFGIGFMANEASNVSTSVSQSDLLGASLVIGGDGEIDTGNPFAYRNLPYILKDKGMIDRVSYSFFLGPANANSGELIFGAIDTSKYLGNLNTIPLINIYPYELDKPAEFDVTLQGVGFVDHNGNATTFNTQYLSALVDTGTTLFQVPQDLADIIAKHVDASYDENLGYYIMNCPSQQAMENSALVLKFGGENYFFPYANFILSTSDSYTCALGIIPGNDMKVYLGDNILRSLYVVYDLENYEISFARANYGSSNSSTTSDTLKTIPSAGVSFAEATKAKGYSSTWSTDAYGISSGGDIFNRAATVSNPWATVSASYFAYTGDVITGYSTTMSTSYTSFYNSYTTPTGTGTSATSLVVATGTMSGGNMSKHSKSNKTTKIVVGVVVPIVVIILAFVAYYFLRRHRKKVAIEESIREFAESKAARKNKAASKNVAESRSDANTTVDNSEALPRYEDIEFRPMDPDTVGNRSPV